MDAAAYACQVTPGKPLLVFSINPGRSGSAYLQALLATAVGAVGAHEDPPTMVGEYLFAVEQQPRAASRDERQTKVEAIEAAMELTPGAAAYIDTTNMFVKTFADVVIDAFGADRVGVIHLRRNTLDVARSFRELGCYTPTNTVSRPWMFDPLSPQSLAATYHRVDRDDPTELIVGYLVETELQGRRFAQENPETAVHDVHLDQLQTSEQVHALFRKLGLSATEETALVVGRRLNAKQEPKAAAAIRAEGDFSEKVSNVLQRFVEAGAPIDAMLNP